MTLKRLAVTELAMNEMLVEELSEMGKMALETCIVASGPHVLYVGLSTDRGA